MPRKYAVLRQFTVDLDRLLSDAESAFSALRAVQNAPTQPLVAALFRPIHSLKGICGMVQESRLLVKAFHLLESSLPPLLPVREGAAAPQTNWVAIGETTFEMCHEVLRVLRAKIELWEKLGADANDSKGLIVAFGCENTTVRVWIPITVLFGLVTEEQMKGDRDLVQVVIGSGNEYLLIEAVNGPVALGFSEILTTGTRLDALQMGVPHSFKEWWHLYHKRSTAGQPGGNSEAA